MSEKWIGSASGSIDLGNSGNIGQSFAVSRIGESLIATVGANYDQSKNNIGLSFLVEPRFLPKPQRHAPHGHRDSARGDQWAGVASGAVSC